MRGTFPKIEAFHSFFTRRQQLLMLYETVNPAWSSLSVLQAAAAASPGLWGRLCPPKPARIVGNKQLEEQPRPCFHPSSSFCTPGVGNTTHPSWRVQKSCKTLSFALTWFLAAKDPSGEPQMLISSALGRRDLGLCDEFCFTGVHGSFWV